RPLHRRSDARQGERANTGAFAAVSALIPAHPSALREARYCALSPLWERATQTFNTGFWVRGKRTPHPAEYVESPPMPSPTRGEGTNTAIEALLLRQRRLDLLRLDRDRDAGALLAQQHHGARVA